MKDKEEILKEYKVSFEANLLDGDDIDDCGKAMLDAKDVFEWFGEWLSEKLDLSYQQGKAEGLREVEEMIDHEKAIHSILAEEWTGIYIGEYKAINPHTEKVETLVKLKQELNKAKE